MELKEILKGMNEFFKIPGIVLSIFFFLSAFKPVSFFSAGLVERKFFSKEKLFVFNAVKYIFQLLIWAFIIYFFATLFKSSKIKLSGNFIFWMAIAAEFIWFLILFMYTNKENKLVQIITSKKWSKLIIIFLFIVCLLCCYSGFYNMVLEFDIGGTFEGILAIVVTLFITTLPVPFIMKPVSHLLNWYTNKVLYWEDDEKNKWYLIHLIDKNSFLVGDHKDYISCKKTKLLKKDDLYEKTIHIE